MINRWSSRIRSLSAAIAVATLSVACSSPSQAIDETSTSGTGQPSTTSAPEATSITSVDESIASDISSELAQWTECENLLDQIVENDGVTGCFFDEKVLTVKTISCLDGRKVRWVDDGRLDEPLNISGALGEPWVTEGDTTGGACSSP